MNDALMVEMPREEPRPEAPGLSQKKGALWRERRPTASHLHDRGAAVRHDLLTGDVPPLGDGAGKRHVVEEIAAPARFEVVHDAVALVIAVGLDPMRGLRLPRLEDDPHVLVGRAHPDL